MKKGINKILSGLMAAALVVSGASSVPLSVQAEEETTAYISFADNAWAVQYWYDGNDYSPVVAETATVDGYGQYTVSLDFTGVDGGVAPDIAFFDVEISNGETAYPDSYMQIDSVKVNGEEVEVGTTYTSSDDGVATRTNLYNTWVSEVTEGRTADGSSDDVTATPVAGDTLTDIETIEVTFTLQEGVAFGGDAEAATLEAVELPAEGTTAYLTFADNAWAVQYWFDGNDYSPIVAENATVTGYGEYTVSLDFTGVDGGVAPDIAFFDVEVAGGEQYFPTCLMNINSVKINGEEVEVGKTYTTSDDGVATRVNLYNTWVTDVASVEGARCEDGDLSDATATPVAGDTLTDIETIEVTFTLAEGTGEVASTEADTAAEDVDLNGTYHAYLGLQTPAYSFRNAFDDATYGRDSDVFNQMSGWDGSDLIQKEGTFTDAEIAGNGTYTVSVTGLSLDGEFDSQEYFNLIFLSTDIPNTGAIEITDMKLVIDGRSVDISPILSPDSPYYVNMLIQNIWNDEVKEIGYYAVPPTEVSITFTVSGFAYDNEAAVETEETTAAAETAAAAETTAEEAASDSVEESSSNTGVIVVVVIVVIVAVVVGVVLAKKKKNS